MCALRIIAHFVCLHIMAYLPSYHLLLFKTYGNVLIAVKTTAHRTEPSVCGPSQARYRFKTKRVTALSGLYLHSKGIAAVQSTSPTILTEQSKRGIQSISSHFWTTVRCSERCGLVHTVRRV